MKLVTITVVFATLLLGATGCSNQSGASGGSHPTGTFAPPVASMTKEQLKARLAQVMPKQAMYQRPANEPNK